MPNEVSYIHQESLLIGKAYVDASNLVKSPEQMIVSGYYHIFKNEEDRNLDDYQDTQRATQGQIQISISVNKPLLSEFNIQNAELKEHQIIQRNTFEETKPTEK